MPIINLSHNHTLPHLAGQTVQTVTFCEPIYSPCDGDLFCRVFLYCIQNLLNFFLVLVWQSMPSMYSEALAMVFVVRQLNQAVFPRSQLVLSRTTTVRVISFLLMKTVFPSRIWSAVHWLLMATWRSKRWPGSQVVPEAESPSLPYQVRQVDQGTEVMEQGRRFLHWPVTVWIVKQRAELRSRRMMGRRRRDEGFMGYGCQAEIYYRMRRILILQARLKDYFCSLSSVNPYMISISPNISMDLSQKEKREPLPQNPTISSSGQPPIFHSLYQSLFISSQPLLSGFIIDNKMSALGVWNNRYEGGPCYAACMQTFTFYNPSIAICWKGCDYGTGRVNSDTGRVEAQRMCKRFTTEAMAVEKGELESINDLRVHSEMFPTVPENIYRACLAGIRRQRY